MGAAIIIVLVAAIATRFGLASWHWLLNRRDGVATSVHGLRVTPTEVIDGYRSGSPRYPLVGAYAEMNQAHYGKTQVVVRGEWGFLIRDIPIRPRSGDSRSLVEFVHTVNHLAAHAV